MMIATLYGDELLFWSDDHENDRRYILPHIKLCEQALCKFVSSEDFRPPHKPPISWKISIDFGPNHIVTLDYQIIKPKRSRR